MLPKAALRTEAEARLITAQQRLAGKCFCYAGPGDGTVKVEEAKMPGMKDFATLHCTHNLLPHDSRTANLVIEFLQTQSFSMSALPPSQPPL